MLSRSRTDAVVDLQRILERAVAREIRAKSDFFGNKPEELDWVGFQSLVDITIAELDQLIREIGQLRQVVAEGLEQQSLLELRRVRRRIHQAERDLQLLQSKQIELQVVGKSLLVSEQGVRQSRGQSLSRHWYRLRHYPAEQQLSLVVREIELTRHYLQVCQQEAELLGEEVERLLLQADEMVSRLQHIRDWPANYEMGIS